MSYKKVKLNLGKELHTIFKDQINMKAKYKAKTEYVLFVLQFRLDIYTWAHSISLENKASIFLCMVWSFFNLSCLQLNVPIYFKVYTCKSFNFHMPYNQLYLQKMTIWPSLINL